MMKNQRWALVLMLAMTLFLLTGCSDDDDPTTPGNNNNNLPTTGTITASIDGTAVDFSTDAVGTEGATIADRVMVGNDGANDSIVLGTPAAVGTYTFGGADDASVTIVYNSAAWISVSGSIVVTASSDTNIEGTFSGSFTDFNMNTVSVTNGSFDVPVVLAP